MDTPHNQITTISAPGLEGHDVHLCHRCGWPFPNPHPSAKHRRAHKRVCGKIQGYEVQHDHHLPVSDDDKTSDEEEHTPIPKSVKRHAAEVGSSAGGVGEMSNRSEDDVFTDAVTEFSDGGLSHQSSERFESVTGLIEEGEAQNGSGSDVCGIESSNINESAGKTEPYNDSTDNKETRNPGALVHPNDQLGTELLVSDSSAEAVSDRLGNNLKDDVIESEVVRDLVEVDVKKCVNGETQSDQKKAGQESDIPVGENKQTSINVDSKEGIISDPAVIVERKEEELHDKLVPEVVKTGLLPQTETLHDQNASAVVESVSASAEISCATETSGEIALAKEIHENTNSSSGVEKGCASTEEVMASGVGADNLLEEASMIGLPPKHAEHTLSPDATEPVDAYLSIKEIDQKSNSTEEEAGGNSGVAEVESARKATSSEIESAVSNASNGEKCDAAGNENDSSKSDHKHSVERTFVAEAIQTTEEEVLKEDMNHCEEKSDRKSPDVVIKTGGGDSEEVKVIHDRNMEELSKSESSTLKSFQGPSSDKLNEELHSVGTDADGLNHNVDVLDKKPVTATSEYPMSEVISELPNNIHVPSSELVPKESALTESGLSNENSDKESGCIGEGVRELDDCEASAELNPNNSVAAFVGMSEGLGQTQQENVPAKECWKEILPDEEKLIGATEASFDANPTKPTTVVLNADQTSDSNNVVVPEKCCVAPSLKEAAPPLLHSQELQETSTPCDKENVINVEPATAANSKFLQAEHEEKLYTSREVVSAKDLSGNSSVKSESLDGNCGTVSDISFESNMAVANSPSSESLITSSEQHQAATEGAHRHKSDEFEPPSFMTLVQSDGKDGEVSSASEIETVQNNQQAKSEALQPGWFPSLTNVVNESEGRKKNEEIIAKVTHSSPVKHHSPLKTLLNDAKQVPEVNPKDETEPIVNNGAGATKAAPAPTQNDQGTHKDIDEWNSPARYPIETKKDKKKGKSIWVPFMCCSSMHKDL